MQLEDAQVHVTKCRCEHDSDHAVSFHYWPDQAFGDEFTISTSLNHYRGFWSRVWIGIKYALGIDNTHYFFTEQTIDKDELLKLQAFINKVAPGFKDQ